MGCREVKCLNQSWWQVCTRINILLMSQACAGEAWLRTVTALYLCNQAGPGYRSQ